MDKQMILDGLELLSENIAEFDELYSDDHGWIDIHELLFEVIERIKAVKEMD